MNDFKSALQKTMVAGFYGFGIVIFFTILAGFIYPFILSQYPKPSGLLSEQYDESAKLEVEVVTESIIPIEFRLVGKVWNRGEREWSNILLRAEIFDANGAYIGDCSHYLSHPLRVGDGSNFSMTCPGGYLGIPLEKYASYTIVVTDALPRTPK